MRFVLITVLLLAACKKPAAPVVQSHLVHLSIDDQTLGQEQVETTINGQRVTSEMRTEFSGPPEIRLQGRLVMDRDRPVALHVTGEAPDSLPSEADLTATPDRTDTFLLRSPLPVHVLTSLVRRSITGARRTFRLLPEGQVDVGSCAPIEGPYNDTTCHAVTGLPSGPALVWLDRRQALAAAVIKTPFGVLTATTPERDASRPALRERFDVYSARR